MGTQHKPGYNFTSMQGLAGIIDHTLFHQAYHTIRKHFTVNAQIFLIIQEPQDGIRNGPDPHLHGCPVGDEISYVTGNLLTDLVIAFTAHG